MFKNTIVKEIVEEYNKIRNLANLNMNFYSKAIGYQDRVINDIIHEVEISVDNEYSTILRLKNATILRRKHKDVMQKTRVFERMRDVINENNDFRSRNFNITTGSGWSYQDIYNSVLVLKERLKKGKKIVVDDNEKCFLDEIYVEIQNAFQKLDEIIEIQENRYYEKRVEKHTQDKLYA